MGISYPSHPQAPSDWYADWIRNGYPFAASGPDAAVLRSTLPPFKPVRPDGTTGEPEWVTLPWGNT